MYFPVPGQGSPPKSSEVTGKVHSCKFEQRRSRIAFVWCWMQLKLQLVLPLLLQTCVKDLKAESTEVVIFTLVGSDNIKKGLPQEKIDHSWP